MTQRVTTLQIIKITELPHGFHFKIKILELLECLQTLLFRSLSLLLQKVESRVSEEYYARGQRDLRHTYRIQLWHKVPRKLLPLVRSPRFLDQRVPFPFSSFSFLGGAGEKR